MTWFIAGVQAVVGDNLMCDAITQPSLLKTSLLHYRSNSHTNKSWSYIFFKRDRLLAINGWDEKFIGWGGEDRDIIERYLIDAQFLARFPEFIYLHLPHPPNQH